MSIKRYCDCCGKEMTERNTPSDGRNGYRMSAVVLGRTDTSLKLGVEVIVSSDGVSNKGDFCKHCILDALADLDDRPKAYAA